MYFPVMCKKKQKESSDTCIDENRKRYREAFGVCDKYLIRCELDENNNEGYIVFIDAQNDIDWVDNRKIEQYEKQTRDIWLSRLDVVQMTPCSNMSEDDKLTFKKKLAVGYELALVDNFSSIQDVIDESLQFLQARNNEISREFFLESALGVVILFGICVFLDIFVCKCIPEIWAIGGLMGGVGSFVSIWTRFGKDTMTGLSSRCLHYLESFCRIIVGIIFAILVICALQSGIILKGVFDESSMVYVCTILGFSAGFSERFVPSLIEKIIINDTKNE